MAPPSSCHPRHRHLLPPPSPRRQARRRPPSSSAVRSQNTNKRHKRSWEKIPEKWGRGHVSLRGRQITEEKEDMIEGYETPSTHHQRKQMQNGRGGGGGAHDPRHFSPHQRHSQRQRRLAWRVVVAAQPLLLLMLCPPRAWFLLSKSQPRCPATAESSCQ